MVTFFPSSPSALGTCGQAYWLSLAYFLMFTVRIWIKSSCLHYMVFGRKVWKKEKQGRCHKLYRQCFMPCPDYDWLVTVLLEQSSTDSLSKGNISKTKGAEGILSVCRLLEMHIFVSPFFKALEFLVKGVVGHCQMAISSNEGQQLLANCWEAVLQVGHSGRLIWAF